MFKPPAFNRFPPNCLTSYSDRCIKYWHAASLQDQHNHTRHTVRRCYRWITFEPAGTVIGYHQQEKLMAEKKKPTHEAFVVTEGDNSFWTRIGAVWPHDDGKGFNIDLIALPVSGRLVIRERKETKES